MQPLELPVKLHVTPFARASSAGVALRILACCAMSAALSAATVSSRTVSPPAHRRTATSAIGRVTGSVEFDGPAPIDTVTHPRADAPVCGASLLDVSVEHRGPRLARAVVWISGVAGGKRMPYARRFDVITNGCRLIPRVQTAIVGGTLNVRNADALTHRVRFTRAGSDDVLGEVTETEPGEVVPTRAALAAPGLVEMTCDHHPWIHGWLAVFGHPYYATTDANGAFAIDSIPPGRYAITAWHERFGSRSDSVTVVQDGTATITLRFPAAAPGSTR
jgi:hypothetical protein